MTEFSSNISSSSTSSSPTISSSSSSFEQWINENMTPEMMQDLIRYNCPIKMVLGATMGTAAGALMGLFLSSLSSETTSLSSEMKTRDQIKIIFKEMRMKTISSAKNFGKVAAIFSGVECVIEGQRARHDRWNGVLAGCVTGGGMAVSAGPQAMAMGCAGFALFSAAIEHFIQS